MATPHGAELRAGLCVVPAQLFHPKNILAHTHTHTQTLQDTYGEQLSNEKLAAHIWILRSDKHTTLLSGSFSKHDKKVQEF